MAYSTEVLERVRTPSRVGTLPAGAMNVGTGEAGTLESGTMTRIHVRVAGRSVVDVRFKVFGCSAAIASASLVAEWLEGAPVDEVRSVTPARIVAALDLPAERHYVAQLAVQAAQQAIEDWRRKTED